MYMYIYIYNVCVYIYIYEFPIIPASFCAENKFGEWKPLGSIGCDRFY